MSEKELNQNEEMELEVTEEEEEMELELDGEDVNEEMEELVAEKVKKEEKDNQAAKSKRGPKAGSKKDKADKEPKEKKAKELDLNNANIKEREIKKGRLSAPCARLEKTDKGDYIMKLSDGVVFSKDAQYKEVGRIQKMQEGKSAITLLAAESLGNRFKGRTEDGKEIEHDYVRVELHKPGRDKDVVELYTVHWAKTEKSKLADKAKRKEESEAKKKEKDAKEKAEKEAAAKEETTA